MRPVFCGCPGVYRFECFCVTPDDCQCEGMNMTEGREELREGLTQGQGGVATGGISIVEDDDCAGLPADQMAQCRERQAEEEGDNE
jgi:hypothetical protein